MLRARLAGASAVGSGLQPGADARTRIPRVPPVVHTLDRRELQSSVLQHRPAYRRDGLNPQVYAISGSSRGARSRCVETERSTLRSRACGCIAFARHRWQESRVDLCVAFGGGAHGGLGQRCGRLPTVAVDVAEGSGIMARASSL